VIWKLRNIIHRWFEFPLLRRELIEIANRRRTYIVRIVAAVILLLVMWRAYASAVSSSLTNTGFTAGFSLSGLGIGDDIVRQVMPFLFGAVWILMPALACTALTSEKEGNTMGNLLITRLSPAMILLEKFCSRLVPMLTILCVAVPLLGYTYTLGGVDAFNLSVSIWRRNAGY